METRNICRDSDKRGINEKTSQFFTLLMVFISGFSSPRLEVTAMPGASDMPLTRTAPVPLVSPTFVPTAKPIDIPTLSTQNIQDVHLRKIQMMDEVSGWSWAVDRAHEPYLLHTTDGGLIWENVTPRKSPFNGTDSSFMFDAQTAWVVLNNESLVRTSDGGQTWKVINQNIKEELVFPFRDWYRLRFVDANHGWLIAGLTAAGAHESFYETRDGGVTWEPADFKTLPDQYNGGNYKNEIAFWIDTDVIYYDLERFIIAPGDQEGILKMFLSTDWGKSWETVQLPPSVVPDQSFNISVRKIHSPVFFNSQNGVLAVTIHKVGSNAFQLFIYQTSDGGHTWELIGKPSLMEDANSEILFLTPRDAVFVCGTKLCVTHDDGIKWQSIDPGITIPAEAENKVFQPDFINNTTGWLLVNAYDATGWSFSSHLLKTVDGGATWMEISPIIKP
jgi:photosystem II stability/assembly factor-like uncharacterized protein